MLYRFVRFVSSWPILSKKSLIWVAVKSQKLVRTSSIKPKQVQKDLTGVIQETIYLQWLFSSYLTKLKTYV